MFPPFDAETLRNAAIGSTAGAAIALGLDLLRDWRWVLQRWRKQSGKVADVSFDSETASPEAPLSARERRALPFAMLAFALLGATTVIASAQDKMGPFLVVMAGCSISGAVAPLIAKEQLTWTDRLQDATGGLLGIAFVSVLALEQTEVQAWLGLAIDSDVTLIASGALLLAIMSFAAWREQRTLEAEPRYGRDLGQDRTGLNVALFASVLIAVFLALLLMA